MVTNLEADAAKSPQVLGATVVGVGRSAPGKHSGASGCSANLTPVTGAEEIQKEHEPSVISSVFTLYCCLSGPKFPPLFPWSSNIMCCNSIIYILSLVRQRRKRAKKSNDSPIQVTATPTVPGNCS